jgi:hypothetical protein
MNAPTPSYSAAIKMVERAYDDLSNPAALAQVRRDYNLLCQVDGSEKPYIAEARRQIKRALDRAAQGGEAW